MSHALLEYVGQVMSSPWVYVLLAAMAAADAFLPAVPSETAVITAAVFATVSGTPNLVLIVVAAAVGAFAGDHVSYLLGRSSIGRLRGRRRTKAVFDRGGAMLKDRGGLILVIARFIPGARTAMTITAGSVAYPLRSFACFEAVAVVAWGVYATLIGCVGGMAFAEEPLKAVLLGCGVALVITALVEGVRYLRRRAAARAAAPPDPAAELVGARPKDR